MNISKRMQQSSYRRRLRKRARWSLISTRWPSRTWILVRQWLICFRHCWRCWLKPIHLTLNRSTKAIIQCNMLQKQTACTFGCIIAPRSSTQKLPQVPFLSTDFGPYDFSYSSPGTWNSIPTSIKSCSSLYSFKCHLKSHLIAQLINN